MKCSGKAGDKVILISMPPKESYRIYEIDLKVGEVYTILKFSNWLETDRTGICDLDVGTGWWHARKHFISYPDEIDRPTKITRKLKEIVKKTKGKPQPSYTRLQARPPWYQE